jgi:hypothetical protein
MPRKSLRGWWTGSHSYKRCSTNCHDDSYTPREHRYVLSPLAYFYQDIGLGWAGLFSAAPVNPSMVPCYAGSAKT